MAFTKVVGAGIHTLSNITSHNINSSGIITATKFVGPIEGNITAVDGVFTGNVSIAKTLTYEDVKNVDSVGVITARSGINVIGHSELDNLNVSGVSTFSGIATASSTLFAKNFSTSGIGTFADIHVKSPVDTRITSIAPGALILSRNTPVILFKNNLSDSFDASIDVVSNELRFKGGGNNATSTRMITTSSGVSFPQNIDVDGRTDLDDVVIAGITTFTNSYVDFKPGNGGNAHFRILSTGSGDAGIFFDAANGDISGSDYVFIGQKNNLDFVINPNVNAGNIDFQRAGTTQVRITSAGNVGIGSAAPTERLVVQGDGFSNLAYDKDGGGFDGTSGGALVLTGIFDYSGSKLGLMVDNAGQGRIMNKTGQNLHLGTGNSKDLTITNVGSVGIATDIVSQKFAVKGATDIMHYPNTTIGNDRLQIGFNAPEGYIKSKNSSGSPASNLAFYTTDTSGNTNKRLHLSYNGRILTNGETANEVSEGGIHIKTANNGGNTQALILENHGSASDTTVTLKLVPSTSTPDDRYNSIKAINVDGQNKFDTVFHTCPGGTPLEAMRIDNQQRVIIGTQYTDTRHEVGDAALQVSGTGPSDSAIAVGRWSNNNQPAFLELSKSRATSITGHTAVVADDILGQVQFSGSDGTRYLGAAFIKGIATNPIADYDVAGYLSFGTNYGTTSPTERLRIRSTGEVSLGQVDSSSSSALHIRSVTSTETTLELSTKSNYSGSLPSAKISFTQQNGTEIARIKCDTNTGAANMADLTFWTNFGGLYERLKITKTGEVSISNTTQSTVTTNGALIVSGGIGVAKNIICGGALEVQNNTLTVTSATPNILMAVPSGGLDSRIYNDGSGNFIIGHGTNSNTPTERLRISSTGEMGVGLTGAPPTGSFTVRLTETPEFNLYSTQHAQNNNCKINFGIGQSASVDGNTGGRIEMNIPNAGGQMTGELKFHTNIGDNLQERLRITHLGGTVINKGGTINTASGWAALEAKAGSSAHQVVLSSTATASNSNYSTLGFKLHPSNDNERVKAAIQCQGSGGGYGEVSRMMFCLDNIADNGNAQGNGDDERFRISPTTGVDVRRDKFGWSTFGHYTGSARTLLRHVREFGTGASAATFNLIRVRRHYWGWGHYKITIKRGYYSGIAEDVYYLNGHGRDDGSYNPSYSIGQRQYGGDGSNFGYSNRITITSPSTSSPGSSYAAYVDVRLECPAYMYFQVEVEGYASTYSTDYTSLASDQYALHP